MWVLNFSTLAKKSLQFQSKISVIFKRSTQTVYSYLFDIAAYKKSFRKVCSNICHERKNKQTMVSTNWVLACHSSNWAMDRNHLDSGCAFLSILLKSFLVGSYSCQGKYYRYGKQIL